MLNSFEIDCDTLYAGDGRFTPLGSGDVSAANPNGTRVELFAPESTSLSTSTLIFTDAFG